MGPSAAHRGVRQRSAEEQRCFVTALSEAIYRDLPERMLTAMQIDPRRAAALLGLGFYGPRDVRRSVEVRSRGASITDIVSRIDSADLDHLEASELKTRVPQIVQQLRNLDLLGVDGGDYFIRLARKSGEEPSLVKLTHNIRELFASYLAPEGGWTPPQRTSLEIDTEDDAARRERALVRESRRVGSLERGLAVLRRIAELTPQLQTLHEAAHDEKLISAARAVRQGQSVPATAPQLFVEMVKNLQSLTSGSKDAGVSLLATLAPQLFSPDLPLLREAVQRQRVSHGLIASVAVRATLKGKCGATLETQLAELAEHREALVSALHIARDQARAEFQARDDAEAVDPYALSLMELCSGLQRTRLPSDYNAKSWMKRGADSWAAEELPKWIALGTTGAETVRECIERAIVSLRG